ncbi:hypothetical protein AAVH_23762 [Aphelenchoides avenae]|nr:hypothetical protein AAVH_23762 [Aphelenchus avenae]
MVPPVDERHGGLTMRQQSESTLQAPAASEDSNRPSSSPPTRTGYTHIDHDRQNDFALRLSLANVPPLLDAMLQLALADIPSLFDDAMLQLPLDDVPSLLDAPL